MNIKGKVGSQERFFGFLRALSESGKTGALVVTDDDVSRRLFLENGAFVGASSTASGDSFGQLLVERAIIHEQVLRNAEALQSEGPALLGRKLVELGVMSEEEVQVSIRLKVKKTIADIVSNPDARFEWVDERLPDKRRVAASLDVGELLTTDTGRLEKRLPRAVAPRRPESEPEKPPQPEPEPESAELLDILDKFNRTSDPPTVAPPPPRPVPPPPARPVRTREAPAPAPQVTAVPERGKSKAPLLAAGALFAGLALAAIGYWLFSGNGEPREEPAAGQANVEDTAIPTPTPGENPEPTQANNPLPRNPVPEARASLGATASAAPAPNPSRPPVGTTPPQTRPADARTAPVPPPPAGGAVTETPRKADPTPAVGKESAAPSVPDRPAPQKETPTTPSLPQSASAPAPSPGPVAEQPPAEGWKGAVFAPKTAVVTPAPPSGPAVTPGAIVEPGPDVIDPVLLEQPKLKYPAEAKRRKLEAVVRVRVLVDENGTVLEAKVDEPVGNGFDEAAIEVALKTRFIPATKGTVPVKMWTVLRLVYRLKR
jgi:TonB family protein